MDRMDRIFAEIVVRSDRVGNYSTYGKMSYLMGQRFKLL